jgi:hypothetical protein
VAKPTAVNMLVAPEVDRPLSADELRANVRRRHDLLCAAADVSS